ncbi:hypothetical protein [Virgibacillus sediminis]|uniref:Uncharacterized protein n=1 Tax=Virgibacillus sediminis TaxID=202260 RepID=A0ABV7A8K5_9BACI
MKKILCLIPMLFIMAACTEDESMETNYYLSLMGESDTWELTGYEMMLTSDGEKAGNGKLSMKEVDEYISDSFSFRTHAVVGREDTVIHGSSVSGRTDIAQQTTGTVEGKGGNPITLDNVSNIYMTVEWWDMDKNEKVQERIELYRKPENGGTFLDGEG